MTPAQLQAIRERVEAARADASRQSAVRFLLEDVPALLDEVERLRAALTELVEAHDAPPWGDGDDPYYEKAVALGRRLDAAWAHAREALGRGGEG